MDLDRSWHRFDIGSLVAAETSDTPRRRHFVLCGWRWVENNMRQFVGAYRNAPIQTDRLIHRSIVDIRFA